MSHMLGVGMDSGGQIGLGLGRGCRIGVGRGLGSCRRNGLRIGRGRCVGLRFLGRLRLDIRRELRLRFELSLRQGVGPDLRLRHRDVLRLSFRHVLRHRLCLNLISGRELLRRLKGHRRLLLGVLVLLDLRRNLVLGRLDIGDALDEVDEPCDDGLDVGARIAAASKGPLQNPCRTRQRPNNEHVVRTAERDLVEALADLGGLAAGDVAGDVGLGEQLNGNVLEQMGKLGVVCDLAKDGRGVTEADVIVQCGHEVENEGRPPRDPHSS